MAEAGAGGGEDDIVALLSPRSRAARHSASRHQVAAEHAVRPLRPHPRSWGGMMAACAR